MSLVLASYVKIVNTVYYKYYQVVLEYHTPGNINGFDLLLLTCNHLLVDTQKEFSYSD